MNSVADTSVQGQCQPNYTLAKTKNETKIAYNCNTAITCLLYKGSCKIFNKLLRPSFKSSPASFVISLGMHVSIAANASVLLLVISSSLNGICVVKIASRNQYGN